MQANSEASVPPVVRRLRALAALSGIFAPLSFLLILGIALSQVSPHFATRDNLKQIAIEAAVVAVLACGQTAVIISGNIDLSVGAVMALSGVVSALAMAHYNAGVLGGVGIALVVGLAAGTFSGSITAWGRIPSFIVTLGMMGVAYGSAGLLAGSRNVGGLAPGYDAFGSGALFESESRDGIPYAILIMLGVAVAMHLLLGRTRWGRSLYAIGGNREAARLSGIPIRRITIGVFALSGLLAGIASIVNVSRTGVAALDAGNGYELYAVAATVIGGTSLFGGQGAIPGTIIGALLMFTIRNGCALSNASPELERTIIGAVVILAVLYDRYGPGRARAARS